MATFSLWARRDSTTANNNELNPIGTSGPNGQPASQITFTDNNGAGDLSLEYNGGQPDPDTQVIIGGVAYNFTVTLTGTLPTGVNSNTVPLALQGRDVAIIQVVVGGQLREYVIVLGQPPATEAQMNGIGSGAIPLSNLDFDPPPFCFAQGTEIATPSGRRPVQDLCPGDAVLTEDGRSVTIAWIGRSRYSRERAASEQRLRPVHLNAHAFGPGLPDRELVVSPQHRIVIEGPHCEILFGVDRAFVIARHLPKPFATSPEPPEDVVYHHILLENHDILVANGLPAESFQPARRMVEALSSEARASLMAVLDILGEEDMLTRPDALPTLNLREARVLLAALNPGPRPAQDDIGGAAVLN
ncbi:Hint domain-containing protein [Tabrizicola sp.]|uniref:Hint domain-containing protein n=1 Tax=Tabrizicola sp. TaxID=2005166 RepID=UPI003F3FA830